MEGTGLGVDFRTKITTFGRKNKESFSDAGTKFFLKIGKLYEKILFSEKNYHFRALNHQ